MKYTLHRTSEDIAAYIAYLKARKLKGQLIFLSVFSFCSGLFFFNNDTLAKFTVPLCIVVPFICLLSYREARRKIKDPRHIHTPETERELQHFTGDMTIECREGKIIISFKKCGDVEEITKKEIKTIVFKHGYMFMHYRDKVLPIPDFEGMAALRRDILNL